MLLEGFWCPREPTCSTIRYRISGLSQFKPKCGFCRLYDLYRVCRFGADAAPPRVAPKRAGRRPLILPRIPCPCGIESRLVEFNDRSEASNRSFIEDPINEINPVWSRAGAAICRPMKNCTAKRSAEGPGQAGRGGRRCSSACRAGPAVRIGPFGPGGDLRPAETPRRRDSARAEGVRTGARRAVQFHRHERHLSTRRQDSRSRRRDGPGADAAGRG